MAGKGDKARNCHTDKFRNNYDIIKWNKKTKKTRCKTPIKIVKYYK